MYSAEIEKAIQAACVLHDGQTRKGPGCIPYVSHVFSVFALVTDYTNNHDTAAAALLHDTLEDTSYTSEAMEEDFGKTVTAIVLSLSEEKSIEDWDKRKKDYLSKVKKGGEAAMLISAADKIHNMRSMIEQYHNDIPGFMATFARYHTKGLVFLQKLSNLLNASLKNDIVHEFNHVFAEFKKFNEHVDQYQKENS
ncbi:hypothetical protein CL655_01680 [bacterium]|nr:hypothetical protein [bacterium]|tara:strand:+ start:3941 stop:4525 length:585 start_codon:yes stop_codon:yes gene_type:complete